MWAGRQDEWHPGRSSPGTGDDSNFSLVTVLSVQEIYKDRQKFSEQVFKVASSDLVNMGISVVSYTLKDIHDDQVKIGS